VYVTSRIKKTSPVLNPEALDLALVEEALGMVENYLIGFTLW
jgi:hypothetical protein